MHRKLTHKERKKLQSVHRLIRDRCACDRIKAVLAYDEGHNYVDIARLLLLDDETIRRHVSDYFKKHKLKPENGGSKSHLGEEDAKLLIAHLREHTYLYIKDICRYVHKTYGIKYSISGMCQWLKRHNFRYKKPHPVPAKADPVKQEDFLASYDALKKEAAHDAKHKQPIYFADSVHPQHQTRLAYGWIMKGERKAVPTTGRQYRVNLIGGICLDGHKFVYKQVEKVNAPAIQSFLKRIRSKHQNKEKIHIIWDNAGYHHSKEVIKCAESLNIKLHYLPPYSPNLNPIERLWKIMHERVTYNRYHEKFADFTEAIMGFIKHIGRCKNILRSRITDNFQTLVT